MADERLKALLERWQPYADAIGGFATLSWRGAVDAGFHGRPDDVERSRELAIVRLMLIVTEVAEAAQDVKKGQGADAIADELADALIRIGDLAETIGLDLPAAVMRAVEKNYRRGHGYNGGLLEGAATDPLPSTGPVRVFPGER